MEKKLFEGVKPPKILPTFFCGLVIHIKNTFCKKIGSKRSFQPSAVVRAIYPPPIWGPSRQLDDQHRNTNMKNKDHLVGQLTNVVHGLSFYCIVSWRKVIFAWAWTNPKERHMFELWFPMPILKPRLVWLVCIYERRRQVSPSQSPRQLVDFATRPRTSSPLVDDRQTRNLWKF